MLGQFHRLLSDLDPAKLGHPLPGFHVTPLYLSAYDATLDSPGAAGRIDAAPDAARSMMRFIGARRDAACVLQRAHEAGSLRARLIHGDPKVNNIMIDDDTGKGTAIIDLDTVGPGLLPHDVGDALRSIANPAGEEVVDLSLVRFDMDLCAAFCSGYLRFAGESLDAPERSGLFDAIRILPFELGLRFFEDYLHGDVYFKVRRPGHNLDRARVQFRLCELIESAEVEIRRVVEAT